MMVEFSFGVDYTFKTKANADPVNLHSPLAMPSVMERSGSGVLSRSRAKTVTNGSSQHSEDESSDEEHPHGKSDTCTHHRNNPKPPSAP